MPKRKEMEKAIMSKVIERINNVNIPPYMRRELGLNDNWLKSISPKKQKMVVKTALRLKTALRKLSKS